jgi:hypothetical protein
MIIFSNRYQNRKRSVAEFRFNQAGVSYMVFFVCQVSCSFFINLEVVQYIKSGGASFIAVWVSSLQIAFLWEVLARKYGKISMAREAVTN